MNGRRGIQLARIAGIDVHLDWSLLIVFGLVVIGLGAGYLPSVHPGWPVTLVWATAFAAGVAFFASVLAHELSHAIVGRAVGIPVHRITLFLFGGLAQMDDEPKTPKAELAMTVVGPLTSLVIGIVATSLGYALAGGIDPMDETALASVGPGASILLWLGSVNVALAVFNMVPAYPLDGGRVFRAIAWWTTGDRERATRWASSLGRLFGWTLIGVGALMALGFRVPFFGTGLGGGLWLGLIGWFVANAARAGYQQILVKKALTGVPVQKVMLRSLETVPSKISLSSFVEDHVMRHDQRCFPVMRDGQLEGLVCIEDLRRVPRDDWASTPVREVMTPAGDLATVEPEADAHEALTELGRRDVDQLPVVDHGELVGLVRRKDLIRWIALHLGDAVPSS